MPFYFDEMDVGQEVEGLQSVLIVPCRSCPAASAAVRNEEPYIQLTDDVSGAAGIASRI